MILFHQQTADSDVDALQKEVASAKAELEKVCRSTQPIAEN